MKTKKDLMLLCGVVGVVVAVVLVFAGFAWYGVAQESWQRATTGASEANYWVDQLGLTNDPGVIQSALDHYYTRYTGANSWGNGWLSRFISNILAIRAYELRDQLTASQRQLLEDILVDQVSEETFYLDTTCGIDEWNSCSEDYVAYLAFIARVKNFYPGVVARVGQSTIDQLEEKYLSLTFSIDNGFYSLVREQTDDGIHILMRNHGEQSAVYSGLLLIYLNHAISAYHLAGAQIPSLYLQSEFTHTVQDIFFWLQSVSTSDGASYLVACRNYQGLKVSCADTSVAVAIPRIIPSGRLIYNLFGDSGFGTGKYQYRLFDSSYTGGNVSNRGRQADYNRDNLEFSSSIETSGGTISYNETTSYHGDSYWITIFDAPASSSGSLYKKIQGGDWVVSPSWVRTNEQGNATKGPWTCDATSDPAYVQIYIKWDNGLETNQAPHSCLPRPDQGDEGGSPSGGSGGAPGGLGLWDGSGTAESGPAATLPSVNVSAGTVSFGRVFFDSTDHPGLGSSGGSYVPKASTLATASFGNKTYLFQSTGADIWVYDISGDPFNPTLVQGGDTSGATLAIPDLDLVGFEIVNARLVVLDGIPYGVMYGATSKGVFIPRIFSINPGTGATSFVGKASGFYAPMSEEMFLFKVGNTPYLVARTGSNAIGIFDFSNPQTLSFVPVYEFPYPYMNQQGEPLEGGQESSGLRFPATELVFDSAGIPYLVMKASAFGSLNNEGALHSETNWVLLWNLSIPSSPRLVEAEQTKTGLSWFEYLTSAERGLALVYQRGFAFDNVFQDLYAIAQVVFGHTTHIGPAGADYNDPDVVASIQEDLARANENIRRTQEVFRTRTQLGVFDIGSSGFLKSLIAPLAERVGGDDYTGPEYPSIIKAMGGLVDMEYANSHRSFFVSSADCSNSLAVRFGYQRNGSFVYLAQDNAPALIAFQSQLKNQNSRILCALDPSSVALLRVDANTVAAYRGRTYYAEVDRVTLSNSIPQNGEFFTPLPGDRPFPLVPLSPSSNSVNSPSTSYSFKNLLNLFSRIINFSR